MPTPIPIINGSSQGAVNEQTIRFRPFSGGESGGTLEGPDAYVAPWVQKLFNLGYSVDYKKSKSPISTLTFSASFSANGASAATNPNLDYQDTWEIIRNTVEKEILESDHPLVYALDPINLGLLKAVMNKPSSIYDPTKNGLINFGKVYQSPNAPAKPGATMNSYGAAIYLTELFISGTKTLPVKQPILKLTRTTNPLYDAPLNVYNIDTILSTASMISDSGVPSNFVISLVGLVDQLAHKAFPQGIPDPPIMVRDDVLILEFGWKKDLSSATKHGNKRIQYIMQYEFGLWDTKLWGYAQ